MNDELIEIAPNEYVSREIWDQIINLANANSRELLETGNVKFDPPIRLPNHIEETE